MATKKEENQLATTAQQSMIVFSDQVPEHLKGGSGRGNEAVQAEDMLVPRIELVQSLSPVRKKSDPAYIDGAEEGMVFNTVTGDLYGEKVYVVPVFFRTQYLVWIDRDAGGGFRGSFADKTEAEEVAASEPNGAQAVPTAEHFVLIITADGKVQQGMVSMARSKLKISRRWNSTISMLGGDRWSRVYELSAVSEKNSNNQDYFNWKVKPVGFPTAEIAKQAEDLYEKIFSGQVVLQTVDPETNEANAAPAESSKF